MVKADLEAEAGRRLEAAMPRPAAAPPPASPTAAAAAAGGVPRRPCAARRSGRKPGCSTSCRGSFRRCSPSPSWLYVVLRSRAADHSAAAETEAQRHDEEFQVADEADAAAIRLELAQVAVAQPRESPEVTVDTAVLQRMSLEERLERTSVLTSMLILRKPGEPPRSFLLDRDKAFSVGRDREKNTLAVPDPALSSQHFRVVPRGGIYYFVDLESTNGSYIGSPQGAGQTAAHRRRDPRRPGRVRIPELRRSRR